MPKHQVVKFAGTTLGRVIPEKITEQFDFPSDARVVSITRVDGIAHPYTRVIVHSETYLDRSDEDIDRDDGIRLSQYFFSTLLPSGEVLQIATCRPFSRATLDDILTARISFADIIPSRSILDV